MLNEANIEGVFKLFDQNGDGHIDMDEMRTVFQNNINHSEEEKGSDEEICWKDIMASCDRNGDGKISFEEFNTVMNEFVQMGDD